MNSRFPPPTEAQLREAYDRSGLSRQGISFDTAMADSALRGSLTGMVNSDRQWAERTLKYGSKRMERMNGGQQ